MLEPIEVPGARRARPAAGARGEERALLDAEPGIPGGGGSLVVISAAGFDQLAHETYDDARRVVGSLSLAVSRTLSRLPPGATYRLLQERIAGAMAAMSLGDQRPQVEGDLDTPVLGGGMVAQQPYLRVAASRGDALIVLPGGAAVGLLPGARVALYPAGTADPASSIPLASAVVSEAGPDEAVARVSTGSLAAGLRGSWAFVTAPAWIAEPLRLAIDPGVPAAEAAVLRRTLTGNPAVQLVASQPDLRAIRAASPSGGIFLRAEPAGAPLGTALRPGEPDFAERLAAAVAGLQRVRMFRRLELVDSAVAVRMEMIPTEPRIDWSQAAPQCSGAPAVLRPAAGGILTLRPREEYVLRFTHEGTEPAYLTVLDLTPDGRVEQLFPLADAQGDDNRLEPGRSFTVSTVCFFAEAAPGTEMVKLFASRRRLDFSTALGGSRAALAVPGLGVHTEAVAFAVVPGPGKGRRAP